VTTEPPIDNALPAPAKLDKAVTTNDLVEEIFELGQAQANLLDGYLKEYLLSHFRDRRLLRSDIDQIREYARWIPRGATVMDWGCGPALPSLVLSRARPDLNLRASNFDMEIQTYKLLWDAAGLEVERLDHPWKLPWADDSIDAVISKGVLEHVPNEQLSLSEVYRVLRHEGTLVASCLPARFSLVEGFNRQFGRPNHPRLYTLSYSKKLLLSCGFHIVWSAFRGACPLATPWAEPIFRIWERTPIVRHLTQNILVVGVKSIHGLGDQNYARHNLKAALQRIESRGSPSALLNKPADPANSQANAA
jgi:SAM-dependent methyltransferase